MKPRYKRRRDQTSRLWRKHRQAVKVRQKQHHIEHRNSPRVKGNPIDTSFLKQIPLIERILIGVKEALAKKRDNFQQQQAR